MQLIPEFRSLLEKRRQVSGIQAGGQVSPALEEGAKNMTLHILQVQGPWVQITDAHFLGYKQGCSHSVGRVSTQSRHTLNSENLEQKGSKRNVLDSCLGV